MDQGKQESFEADHVEPSSQAEYVETAYEDASWEVVGVFEPIEEFLPLEFQVLNAEVKRRDPMFADYGGLPTEEMPTRWHVPGQGAYAPQSAAKAQEVEEEDARLRISQEELDALVAAAEKRGQQAGYEEAVAQNLAKFQEMEKRVGEIINDINVQLGENLARIEMDAVQLALNIANKIITFAVEINPEYIVQVTREAIKKCGGATIKKVRVSAEDMEFIEVIGVDKRMKEFDGTWHFEKDETIKAGCVLETSAGEVDFQLDRAWARVQDEVVKVIK